MSQHDMDVANQGAASFRADMNLALVALVSQNSGATEPSTMFAYMLWYDTATNILKQRNAANDAWINVIKMDQSGDLADTLYVNTLIDALTDNTVDIGNSTRAFKDIYMQGDLYLDNDNSRTQKHYMWVPLAVANPSGAATVDFVMSSYIDYDSFWFSFEKVLPASSGDDMLMRMSTDGGSTFDDTADDYMYELGRISNAALSISSADENDGATSILLAENARNNSGGFNGNLYLYSLADVSTPSKVIGDFYCINSTGTAGTNRMMSGGVRNASQVDNAVRFFMAGGNTTSGKIILHGRKNI